jgi:CDP-diglyceride synthetase
MKIQIKANILELRIYACVLAYIATFIGSILLGKDIWHIPLLYIILVIFFDQMTRFIAPSPINEKDLSEKYKITQDQLNTYVKSKRNYRIFAAGVATIIALFMILFNYKFSCYFVRSYITLWGFYPLYRMFILKIPAPKSSS